MIRLSYQCAIAMSLLAAALPQSKAADVVMPVALASLQPGQWQLRSTTAGTPPKTLCLGDPRMLLQLRHSALSCNRFIITNEASYAVVNYSCAGSGSGRTSVRVETPRVIQIESQGIADKSPFEISYEGRRIGGCPLTKQAVPR